MMTLEVRHKEEIAFSAEGEGKRAKMTESMRHLNEQRYIHKLCLCYNCGNNWLQISLKVKSSGRVYHGAQPAIPLGTTTGVHRRSRGVFLFALSWNVSHHLMLSDNAVV